ncbi:VTT domain-containing protein [Actinoplanes sp. NPDC049802]|uniref:DedA family protein n=1 Tax=Actinoplanes sp. NPDC049802 TaxID=3154742 RepID=UPI0033E86BE7
MAEHLMPLICSPWLYLIVFAAVAVDGFLPIVPSEAAVIGLGALSASGSPDVSGLVVAVVAGGMTGDRVAYLLGRKTGGRFRGRRLAAARDRAERALLRHGAAAILIGRFLPGGRTATTVTSGQVSLPPGRFCLFTGLAGLAWAAYTIGLGRLGGARFADSPLLAALFGIALGTAFTVVQAFVDRRRAARRPALPSSDPEPVSMS